MQYTIHFQKYPWPGAKYGIDNIVARFQGERVTVVLRGRSFGFEENIFKLFEAGICVVDLSDEQLEIQSKRLEKVL